MSTADMPSIFQTAAAMAALAVACKYYAAQVEAGRPRFLAMRDLAHGVDNLAASFPAANLHRIRGTIHAQLLNAAQRYLYHDACGGETTPMRNPGDVVSIVRLNN